MNKFMKKGWAMALVALFACINGVSAQDVVTIDDVQIVPGETTTITVNYTTDLDHAGFQMRFTLPEGLDFVANYDEDENYISTLGDACLKSHVLSESALSQDEEGNLVVGKQNMVLVYHMKLSKLKKEGTLLTFDVRANENFSDEAEITVTSIKFEGGQYLSDMTVKVAEQDPVAICNANVESAQALVNVYTLDGVLVRKNVKQSEALNGLLKGIYVVNGKKVVVG